jgi:hypothetical protein
MKTKKWDLDLGILLAPAYGFHYPSFRNGFHFEKADIEFSSEYDNRIEFVINLDFQELYESQPARLIENLYLQYDFSKLFKIRAGQYKIPFGEEIARGITERPYLEHSLASTKLAPGRRQGVMILGKGLFSYLGYRAGIFNTSETDKPENETPYISTAGKLFFELDKFHGFSIKSGYSVYYSLDEIFAQSAFLDFSWQILKLHKLSLFTEYLEERFYHYYWNNSIFLCLSYRVANFEIYCSGEFYDENTGHMDKDDSFVLSSGINLYLLKDHLKTSLGHKYLNEYQAGVEENWFTLMIMWEH